MLLHYIEILVLEQICLFLIGLTERCERRCDHAAGRRMLAEQSVGRELVLTLDKTSERQRVAFEQSLVHQLFAAAILQPYPCILVEFISAEGLAVLLPSREVFTR